MHTEGEGKRAVRTTLSLTLQLCCKHVTANTPSAPDERSVAAISPLYSRMQQLCNLNYSLQIIIEALSLHFPRSADPTGERRIRRIVRLRQTHRLQKVSERKERSEQMSPVEPFLARVRRLEWKSALDERQKG